MRLGSAGVQSKTITHLAQEPELTSAPEELEELEVLLTNTPKAPDEVAAKVKVQRMNLGAHHMRFCLEEKLPAKTESALRPQEITVYRRGGGVALPIEDQPYNHYPSKISARDPSDASVQAKIKNATKVRQQELNGNRTPNATLPSEGLERTVHTMHMGSRNFHLVEELAAIGEREGFRVMVHGGKNSRRSLDGPRRDFRNLDVVEHPAGRTYRWAEDNGDIAEDGSVRYPARISGDDVSEGMTKGRAKRFYRGVRDQDLTFCDPKEIRNEYSKTNFPRQGGVAIRDATDAKASVAAATNTNAKEMVTYLEGGNVLMMEGRDGERHAVVGMDTRDIAMHTLQKELGRPVHETEVKRWIGHDLGVTASQVSFVEQPGDFHLDMSMVPLADGKMMVNDSMKSYANQEKWLRQDHAAKRPPINSTQYTAWTQDGAKLEQQLGALERRYQKLAQAEAKTVEDLRRNGVEVVRMGGRYFDPERPKDEIMNFINGEGGTNPGGDRFFVTLGGDPRAQAYAAKALTAHAEGPDRVYFMGARRSELLLRSQGGLSCVVKTQTR